MIANEKIKYLEMLRGVAILLTLGTHLSFLIVWGDTAIQWIAVSFWCGVDLFFAISGFVIVRSLIADLPVNRNASEFVKFIIPFYIRRIYRLWPSAFLWLGITLMLSVVCNKSGAIGSFTVLWRDALAAILQVANFHISECIKIGDCSKHLTLSIFWSLSLEEQFYFVIPILIFFVPRKKLVFLLIFLTTAQFFLYRPTNSVAWFFRTDALLLGSLIALADSIGVLRLVRPVFLNAVWKTNLAVGILIVLTVLVTNDMSPVTLKPEDKSIVFFSTGLMSFLTALIVFVGVHPIDYAKTVNPLELFFIYLGQRSYSIYLIHVVGYATTREFFFRAYPGVTFDHSFTFVFIIVAVGITVIFSELNYRLVETRFRLIGRQKADVFKVGVKA